MNLSLLWSVTDLMSKLCTVTTMLEEDPHYDKATAVNDLREIIEYIDETLYSKAIHPIEQGSPTQTTA